MFAVALGILSLWACDKGVTLGDDTGSSTGEDTGGGSSDDSDTPIPPADDDGDGYTVEDDCDDGDASSHPGGDEGTDADGADQDCDGVADDLELCDGVYGSIQAAIDAASDGFTIIVCAGTYAENLLVEGRSLTLIAEEGSEVTILDGGGLGVTLTVADSPYFSLQGFTVTGGVGDTGGGLFARGSELDIVGNVFTANSAVSFGGGAHFAQCQGSITDNVFDTNTAGEGGGAAIVAGDLEIRGNTFYANHAVPDATLTYNGAAPGGGGLWMRGNSAIEDNVFDSNVSDINGGAMYTINSSGLLAGNTVENNSCLGDGGGFYLNYTTSEIRDSHFEANQAGDDAGGLRLYVSSAVVKDNSFVDNAAGDDGGGLKLSHSRSQVLGNSFFGNSAGDAGGGFELDNDNSLVAENSFTNNRAARGGGMNAKDNTARYEVRDNSFTDNTASEGGGLRVDNSAYTVTGSRNVFENNSATVGASVLVNTSTMNLDSSLMVDSGGDAVAYVASGGTLTNLTIWGSTGAALALTDCAGTNVVNSVMVNNTVGVSVSGCEPGSWTYSLTWNNTTEVNGGWSIPSGSGNVSGDPLFTDSSGGDFTLSSSSPAVDTGSPSLKDPDGSRSDMGAYGGPDAL